MEIIYVVSDYIFSFIFQMIGITIAVTVLSLVLYFIFSRVGWTRISEKDSKWLKLLLISATTIVGVVIGVVFGAQIAATSVSVKIVDDVGKLLLHQALVQVAEPLQYSVNEDIDLSKLKLLIASVENITITNGSSISDKLANSAFDLVKTPFTSHAGKYISQFTTADKIAPAQVVDIVWGKVISTIEFSTHQLILTLVYYLLFWLLSITVVSIVLLSLVRFCNDKVRLRA